MKPFKDLKKDVEKRQKDHADLIAAINGVHRLDANFSLSIVVREVAGSIAIDHKLITTRSKEIDSLPISLIEKYVAARKALEAYITGDSPILNIPSA